MGYDGRRVYEEEIVEEKLVIDGRYRYAGFPPVYPLKIVFRE